MTTENQNIDLDNFNLDFSETEAPAGFAPPPAGRYKFALTWLLKVVSGVPSLEETWVVLEPLELADPDLLGTVKEGHKFNTLTGLTPERAGYLKARSEILAAALGTGQDLRSLLEVVQGVTVEATLKLRQDKNDPTKFYPKVLDEGFAVV